MFINILKERHSVPLPRPSQSRCHCRSPPWSSWSRTPRQRWNFSAPHLAEEEIMILSWIFIKKSIHMFAFGIWTLIFNEYLIWVVYWADICWPVCVHHILKILQFHKLANESIYSYFVSFECMNFHQKQCTKWWIKSAV